jgi:hypothetical protein
LPTSGGLSGRASGAPVVRASCGCVTGTSVHRAPNPSKRAPGRVGADRSVTFTHE